MRSFAGRLLRARLVVLALAVVALAARADGDDLPDPLPIRRVALPAAKVAAELKRAADGVLVRMKRDDFERLVQKAALAKRSRQSAPRLVEASYRASLADGTPAQLVGTARWKIHHPGTGPALLRLIGEGQAFNLAVKQPRIGNRDAILSEFPDPVMEGRGRSLALYLDQPGDQELTTEWSARAEPRPEGLLIDLRLPECPAGSLEVELPADRVLTLVDGAPVAGPIDTEAVDRKVWRVAIGGKEQVSLLLRKGGPPGANSVVFAAQKTVQKLSRDGLESTFTYSVEAVDQALRELNLEFDPLLRPVDVSAPGLEGWKPASPGKMTVLLAKPLREGTVEIRCVAPFTAAWTSPSMRLLGAVPRGETLELWLHPELRLTAWSPGDFRLMDSAEVTDAERKVQYRRLTMQGGGVGAPRRPGGTILAGDVEVRVRQQSWWRLGSDAMDLLTRIDYEVRQGQLFQLSMGLPPGWDVEAVEVTPAELLPTWKVRGDKGPVLQVDFRRPLGAGGVGPAASLTVRLRRVGPTAEQKIPFPDVQPLGARDREGGLALDFEEQAQSAEVTTRLASVEPPAGGLWGKLLPDYYYPFRGENPIGTVHLRPRPTRLRASAHTDLLVAGAPGGCRAALETRLLVEAEAGLPAHVDLYLSEPANAWTWRIEGRNHVRRVERNAGVEASSALAPLAASSPFGAAALAAARPAGSYWRLVLDRPLPVRQALTIRASTGLEPTPSTDGAASRWRVPLVTVLHAGRHEGEVTVWRSAADLQTVAAVGMRESTQRAGSRAEGEGVFWRAYRYDNATSTLSLEARHAPQAPVARSSSSVARAALVSTLTAEGGLRHHFRFRLERWPQRTLPVVMPPGAKLLAVGIDGRWLEQPGEADEDNTLSLPVPTGPVPVEVELHYTTRTSPGGPGMRLQAPPPALPLAPASFDRLWRLPPGTAPVGDGKVAPLVGSAGVGPRHPAGWLLDLFRTGPALPLPGRAGDKPADRDLLDAFAGLRNDRGGSSPALASVVADLATALLRQRHPLVVDRPALNANGVNGSTVVEVLPNSDVEDRNPPWKENGLVFLTSERGVLLTTRITARHLPVESIGTNDPSGRFVSALEWLAQDGPTTASPSLLNADEEIGWTGWSPLAGADADTLPIVRVETVRVTGLALAALVVALAIVLRRLDSEWRARLLLIWLMGWGLGLAWLPSALAEAAWWPVAAGLALGVPWYVLWASGMLRRPTAAPTAKSTPPATTPDHSNRAALLGPGTALLLLLAATHGPARPADPPSEIVFLLPAEKDQADQSVLATVRLVEQLEALARPGVAPCAVLVSGRYEGKIVEGKAEFSAALEAMVLGDGPATVELPFDGVQLVGDVLVDGTRALPTALPSPRPGYALRLRKVGRHKIELRFRAPLTAPGDDDAMRQVSFNVPALVQSRLVFQAPEGARHLRVPFKHGGAKVSGEASTPVIEADLGGITTPLRLRWNQESAKPRVPQVEYQEAYLWDLRADASLLTGLMRYQISQGAVTSLAIDLPAELAVRSVQARRPAPEKSILGDFKSLMDPIRVSGWSVEGDGPTRVLKLAFPVPVTGGVEVTLELVPRAPWASLVPLPLPMPQGVPAPQSPSYLAYRHQGLQVTRSNWLRLTGIRPSEFAPFWPLGSRPATATLAYASSFRREPRQPPELRLQLAVEPAAVKASQSVAFRVGPAQAEMSARIEVSAPDRSLSLLEWEIVSSQPVAVAGVNGPGVSRWSQSGNRLLVWLDRTTTSATLTLSGWVPISRVAGKPGASLEVPCLRLLSPGETRTQLTVLPAHGLALSAEGIEHLTPAPPAEAGALAFVAMQPTYRGRILLRRGPVPEVDVVTTARLEGKEVVFSSAIEYRMPGETRAIHLRLRDWSGDAWLDAPVNSVKSRREEHRRGLGRQERAWALELNSAAKGPVRLTVRGRLSLEDGQGVLMPAIMVPGARVKQQFVVGDGLRAESHSGLEPAPSGRLAWQVVAGAAEPSGWHLRLAPRDRPSSAPARLLFAELRTGLPDGRHWEHEARLWVQHESAAELSLRLPVGARLLGARLEGVFLSVREPEGGVVWVPLAGPGGLRELVVRYRREGGDRIETPDLTLPTVEGAQPSPTLWTVGVPAGWDAVGPGAPAWLGNEATRRLVLELYRAEMSLARSRELVAGRETAELARAQRQFARSCWLADLALEAGADGRRAAGPASLPASAWLGKLRQENTRLAKEQQFEAIREEAERKRREFVEEGDTKEWSGSPRSWLVMGGEGMPVVRLVRQEDRRVQQALVFSGQWLVGLLAVFAATLSGAMRTLARWVWPEQLMLAGVLGWHFEGLTAVVLVLVCLGGLGRLVHLGNHIRWLFPRVFANQQSKTAGNRRL